MIIFLFLHLKNGQLSDKSANLFNERKYWSTTANSNACNAGTGLAEDPGWMKRSGAPVAEVGGLRLTRICLVRAALTA